MPDSNFSIVTARDLVSNLTTVQLFLNQAPEAVSSDVISELTSFQYKQLCELDSVLAVISRGDGVSPC